MVTSKSSCMQAVRPTDPGMHARRTGCRWKTATTPPTTHRVSCLGSHRTAESIPHRRPCDFVRVSSGGWNGHCRRPGRQTATGTVRPSAWVARCSRPCRSSSKSDDNRDARARRPVTVETRDPTEHRTGRPNETHRGVDVDSVRVGTSGAQPGDWPAAGQGWVDPVVLISIRYHSLCSCQLDVQRTR